LKIPKEVIRRGRTAKREVGEKGVGEGGEGGRGRGGRQRSEKWERRNLFAKWEKTYPPQKNVNK
jgi:hypothetical protein